jgi:hypothetical protein
VSLVLQYDSYRPLYHVDVVFFFLNSVRVCELDSQKNCHISGKFEKQGHVENNLLVKTDVMHRLIWHLLNIISKIKEYK